MFKPTRYRTTLPFHGDGEAAMNLAKTTLISLGFQVTVHSRQELHAVGPGQHSNHQPPLVGITDLKLRVSRSEISADALLGGAATMRLFVALFPPGLVLALLLFFALLGMPIPWLYLPGVLAWLPLGLYLGGKFDDSAKRALDNLLNGMAQSR